MSIGKVHIFGAGNLAFHWLNMLSGKVELSVSSRNITDLQRIRNHFQLPTFTLNDPPPVADLYLLAVSDEVIVQVADLVKDTSSLVVHCSGATPLSVLKNGRTGVIYPLQTFSKNRPLNASAIPFFVEGKTEQDQKFLLDFALKISPNVEVAASEKRLKIHLAAVVVNNFVNHLYALAAYFLAENQISTAHLAPLMRETLEKALALGAKNAQTGPAKRADLTTMERHIALLKDANLMEIYKVLSHSIIDFHQR